MERPAWTALWQAIEAKTGANFFLKRVRRVPFRQIFNQLGEQGTDTHGPQHSRNGPNHKGMRSELFDLQTPAWQERANVQQGARIGAEAGQWVPG